MLLLLFLLLFLLIVFILIYFKSTPYFLNKYETHFFLYLDMDGWLQDLSEADLYARSGQSNRQKYFSKIQPLDFNKEQKHFIKQCAKEADQILYNNKHETIANINWNFALTNSVSYENGLAHTRNQIIFLSTPLFDTYNEKQFINLLIHEKYHIFQRLYPKIIENELKQLGYLNTNRKNINKFKISNPDENKYIYSKNGILSKQKYLYHKPSSILDSEGEEHPFELIAHKFVKELKKNFL